MYIRLPVIDQDDLELTPVAGIHHPRTVHHADGVTGRQTATGGNQSGVAFGDGDGDARRHHRPLPGFEYYIITGMEINPGITIMSGNRDG